MGVDFCISLYNIQAKLKKTATAVFIFIYELVHCGVFKVPGAQC